MPFGWFKKSKAANFKEVKSVTLKETNTDGKKPKLGSLLNSGRIKGKDNSFDQDKSATLTEDNSEVKEPKLLSSLTPSRIKGKKLDENKSASLIKETNLNVKKPKLFSSLTPDLIKATKFDKLKSTEIEHLAHQPLELQPYYHGSISKNEVRSLLSAQGDFLVRKSIRDGEVQTMLSVMWNCKARHFLIIQEGLLFKFEGEAFPSIGALIMYYMRTGKPVTEDSGVLLLRPIRLEKWEIPHENVKLKQKLGEGSFGQVHLGVIIDPQRGEPLEVAVKTCHVAISDVEKRKFLTEAEIMRKYIHPNVVRMIGVCAQKDPIMIVMELVPGGDLKSHLKEHKGRLLMRAKSQYAIDACSGMEYLESNSCIHRDLAARNCLVGRGTVIKIGDFGMSKIGTTYTLSGATRLPVRWTSPEAFTLGRFTSKSDVWSFGVLLWEIFTDGNTPYEDMAAKEIKIKVKQGYRLLPPANIFPDYIPIMEKCWKLDPNDRPTFKELCRQLKTVRMFIS